MRLESGRRFLYQWELDQKLLLDVDCKMVHFANGTTEEALSVDVIDGKANVPNIFLQATANIKCYAWNGNSVVAYGEFSVRAREKPAEYVYTETAVRQYDKLLEELEKKGAYYVPVVDGDGNLRWEKSLEQMPDVPGGNIRGPIGEKGEKGEKGDPGEMNIDDTAVGGAAWSSKQIVDELCPGFIAEGAVVVCEPLEGYPLKVISTIEKEDISSITLHQENEDESRDYTVDLPFGVTDGAFYWTTGELIMADDETIQLTPQVITALHGENTFTSDSGDTTVSGKMDPNVYWAKKFAEQEAELAKLNKQYELIEEVTLTEAVASFTRDKDANGVPYNFSGVRIYVTSTAASAAQSLIFQLGTESSAWWMYHQQGSGLTTDTRHTYFKCCNDNGHIDYFCVTSTTNSAANVLARANYLINTWQNITKITLSAGSTTIPAGTKIKIWAIRG